MPEAPATQPRPNDGIRFTSGRSPSFDTSSPSMDGAEMPVTEVNRMKSTSAGRRPHCSRAARMARSPSRVATSMKRSFVSSNAPRSR